MIRVQSICREDKLAAAKSLTLKPGREKPILKKHPWIFSGAIQDLEGNPSSGDTVKILDAQGGFLAWGAFSPHSQIRTRVWSWDQEQEIGEEFFRARIQKAFQYRKAIGYEYPMRRLVHAESDLLPGLIVDQYGDLLVVQVLSAGPELWRETIYRILLEETGAKSIYERSDVQVRELEGLELRQGPVLGDDPPDLLEIEQSGLLYRIDIRGGHKTGYYLDQRSNREFVGSFCRERNVLDCFSYSGGFSLQALKNQAASLTLVDESSEALKLAEEQIRINHLDREDISYLEGDVFNVLRKFRDQAKKFDLIILDPPKFAPTAALAERAARGYKDINLLAFKLLNPGGMLATFSCSGGISRDFFLRILSGAAKDAGVNARIHSHMGQSADHSVNLSFPEGTYLKGFAIYVDEEEV